MLAMSESIFKLNFRVFIMKNMKLSTAAAVLLSALGVSTAANAAKALTDFYISVAPGVTPVLPGPGVVAPNNATAKNNSIAIGQYAGAGPNADIAIGDH